MRQILDSDDGLNEYQAQCDKTAIYPGKNTFAGLEYTVLGFIGESGEVANKLKKVIRDKNSILSEGDKLKLIDEMGDVLWYLAMMAEELKTDLAFITRHNLVKLRQRAEQNKLHGSGDTR